MIQRLLSAAAVSALAVASAAPANAQTATTANAKTEAAAAAATGKVTTDKPAATAVQGTAKAVKQAAPTGAAANVQAAAQATTPATPGAGAVAVQGDLVETLRTNGQFGTFLKALDATNLTGLVKTNKNLTVFAPTDAAFQALPAGELTRLQGDKTAMQKFLLHHIINAPVDSTKIKGAKGPVASGAGDSVLLDGSDEAGALKVDGATIVQADIRTGSGLLHVVDKPLVAGQGGAATTAAAGADASATASAKPKT